MCSAATPPPPLRVAESGKMGGVCVLCLDRFLLLVYFDNNIDGIKESLHYTNFNNQKDNMPIHKQIHIRLTSRFDEWL